MSDLEDQHSANLAPVNGLSDNATDYDDSNLGPDTSHFSKFGDQHSPTYDPFSCQPSSAMAHTDYNSSAHEYGQYEDEADFPRANQSRDYGHFKEDLAEEDLPANFAKEVARHQNLSESDQFEDEQRDDGNEYEAEEYVERDSGADPFTVEALNKGNGGGYVDNSDRPIMGYNPFLNEEARDEKEEAHVGASHEESDHFHEGGYETEGDDRRELGSSYNRLENDEDHDDVRDDKADDGYDEDAKASYEDEEPYDDDTAADNARSIPHEQTHSEAPKENVEQLESNSRQARESGEYDSHQFDDGYDTRGGLDSQSHFDGYQYPGSQQPDIDFESVGVYEDEQREDVENVPPQTSQVQEDDLGIVNQGFSDDVDLEGGKIIPEEDIVESEAPVTEASRVSETELYEEEGEDRKERERVGEEDIGFDYGDVHGRREENDEERYDNEDGEEAEQGIPHEEDKLRHAGDENDYVASEKEDYTKETDRIKSGEEYYIHEQDRFDEEETEHVGGTKEDYTHEPLRMSEEMERSTLVEGGHYQDTTGYDDADSADEKDLSSHYTESNLLSKDRSFVDNLSDVTSPETIPQPLPSPPEPKNLSSFEPESALDSASPTGGENVVAQQQHSSLFQQAAVLDESNTTDFLTAGEVEGETKFDVDGTAITSTSQNNAFLHSDEDDDEEEEDEEGSQHLDQGLTTTGTTETETSVDDRSGEYGVQQMTTNDNALMSMSMEGSFYDDGGELIGGDDRRNQDDNVLYDEGVSVGEELSQHERFQPKQENLLDDDHTAGFSEEVQSSFVEEDHSMGFDQKVQNNFVEEDHIVAGFGQDVQNSFVEDQESKERNQVIDDFESRGGDDDKVGDYDFESHSVDPPHHASEVNGGYEEETKTGGYVDSLIDVQIPEPVPQSQTTEHSETADSSVDIAGVDFTANESESSVDSQQPHPHEQLSPKDVDDGPIPDVAAAKPEEPASSVEASPVDDEATSGVALGAAAATGAGVAVAAAAASAATTVKSTTTTVKKSSAKVGGKTTTSTTTTKVTKETKATNGKTATTKKSEITATAAKTTPRKPAAERPTSAAISEKKTPVKTTTSPTKTPTSAPASAKGPLPSYAQPVAPRKPREPKAATTTEEKKKPLATTTTLTTSRTSSATHRSPRPQSATAATTSSSTSTTASSATTTATKTTKTSVTTTTTSRAALLSRPKSSPTKLTNGTAAAPSDTKSPTKKYGIDSKNEGYKPGGGTVKATTEKKEVKTKVETVAKSSTVGATPTKSPTKTTTPRPTSTPKAGEAKSKIGSMENATHTPGGGNVRIASKKPDFTNVTSKIGSKDKMDHKPGGGNVKIESKKVKVEAKSKIGSLNNATHKPGGGDKKIETKQLDWKVESKIGSLDNAEHIAGGGDKKIETKKLDWTANSKIGSLDNAQHIPEGGDKKIETKKLNWKVDSKIGSLDNAQHKAGGGDRKIDTQKLDWKVDSKVGSLENAQHKAGGGDKKIEVQKTEWKAQSKIGSLDNVKHKPGGGDDKQTDSPKTSKTESIDKAPGSGSEQGATEVHNGAASEN